MRALVVVLFSFIKNVFIFSKSVWSDCIGGGHQVMGMGGPGTPTSLSSVGYKGDSPGTPQTGGGGSLTPSSNFARPSWEGGELPSAPHPHPAGFRREISSLLRQGGCISG